MVVSRSAKHQLMVVSRSAEVQNLYSLPVFKWDCLYHSWRSSTKRSSHLPYPPKIFDPEEIRLHPHIHWLSFECFSRKPDCPQVQRQYCSRFPDRDLTVLVVASVLKFLRLSLKHAVNLLCLYCHKQVRRCRFRTGVQSIGFQFQQWS